MENNNYVTREEFDELSQELYRLKVELLNRQLISRMCRNREEAIVDMVYSRGLVNENAFKY